MGAAVAWEYAARHLDMVSCLVLLDASPDPPGETDAYVPGPQTPFGLRSPDEIIECAAARAGRMGWTGAISTAGSPGMLAGRRGAGGPEDSTRRGTRKPTPAGACGRALEPTGWTSPRIACPTLVVIGETGIVGRNLGEQLTERLRHGSRGHAEYGSPRALAEPRRHPRRGAAIMLSM